MSESVEEFVKQVQGHLEDPWIRLRAAEDRAVRAVARAERERSKRLEAEAEVARLREDLALHDAAAAMKRLSPEEVHRFIHWRESEATDD